MTLRVRLAVSLALLVVPFAFGVTLYQLAHHERVMREAVADQVQARMGPRERALCEARPDAWPHFGRRGRRRVRFGRLFPYRPDFTSANSNAPRFPEQLRRELGRTEVASARHGRGLDVVVRMPWKTGPCAIVLLRRGMTAAGRGASPWFPAMLISLAAVVLAVFAAGPIVGRIRRLTQLVLRDDEVEGVGGNDEIAELARAFANKRKELQERVADIEAQDLALREYLANTSHDVMIPVTVLQGHLAALSKRLSRESVGDLPGFSGRIEEAIEECHYLTSMLRNLGVAAKLDVQRGGVEQHAVDLTDLVDRVVVRHQTLAQSLKVSLESATPEAATRVNGDVTLLEQAIGNLVHNAIRYNQADGHVAVVLDSTPEGFELTVRDDGPGLSEEDIQRLTERGYRGARARANHPSGLGLGLSIARQVADKHGFRLTFTRPAEGGFKVSLVGPEFKDSAR